MVVDGRQGQSATFTPVAPQAYCPVGSDQVVAADLLDAPALSHGDVDLRILENLLQVGFHHLLASFIVNPTTLTEP